MINTNVTIEEAFKEYVIACYGDSKISNLVLSEIRQAFFAGMVWTVTFGENLPNNKEGEARYFKLREEIQAFADSLNQKGNK